MPRLAHRPVRHQARAQAWVWRAAVCCIALHCIAGHCRIAFYLHLSLSPSPIFFLYSLLLHSHSIGYATATGCQTTGAPQQVCRCCRHQLQQQQRAARRPAPPPARHSPGPGAIRSGQVRRWPRQQIAGRCHTNRISSYSSSPSVSTNTDSCLSLPTARRTTAQQQQSLFIIAQRPVCNSSRRQASDISVNQVNWLH